ncbi:MAG: histidine kinase [Bacteroidetes bacterium]|nr:MAG: histidine kinase [Bacteroidota bacterium]
MIHPVFQSLRSISVYFGTWILIAGIHFSILFFQFPFPFAIAVTDSLIYTSIFCIIGIAVWYVIRYSMPGNHASFSFFFNHFTSLVLLLVFWIGTGYALLNLLFRSDTIYMNFLMLSIPYRFVAGILQYAFVGLAYYLIIIYRDLQEKAKAENRLNELLKESELNMLKSQINPHFLFNSLNSISSLTITDPGKAQEMVVKLSEFLRYSVSSNINTFTTLDKEINNIQRYLEIEKIRFGDKFVFDFTLAPECSKLKIPVMILQPLFENAIKHGVYESTEQVRVITDCKSSTDYFEIRISNDFDPSAPARKGAGIGLKNIKERLRLMYRNDSLLKTSVENNIFQVVLTIPNKPFENNQNK